MKKQMKKTITTLFLLLVLLPSLLRAQQPQAPSKALYTYDASGNRVRRELVPQRSMQDSVREDKEAASTAAQWGLQAWPNPVQARGGAEITITGAPSAIEEPVMLTLLDNTGRIIIKEQPITNRLKIELAGYPSGVYYIRAQRGKEQVFYKIVKTE